MAKKYEKNPGQEAYRQFKKALAQGTLGSLYIFHGEEAYLRDYYLDQMKAKLIPAGMESFNYHLLPGKTLAAAGGDGGCPAHDEPAHLGGGQRL